MNKPKDIYEALATELTARKIMFPKRDEDNGFNKGLNWALDLVVSYKNGRGMWQDEINENKEGGED